jgi:hypothetical protein
MTDVWPFELEDFDQLGKALPVVATPLTAAVPLAVEHPRYLIEEVINAVEVAANTIVVICLPS